MKQIVEKKTQQRRALRPKLTHTHRAKSSSPKVDVMALAQVYNSPATSRMNKEELLEEARRALMKYELAEDEQEIAAAELARTMHMLVEQHGPLEADQKIQLEQQVIEWCGLCDDKPEPTKPKF